MGNNLDVPPVPGQEYDRRLKPSEELDLSYRLNRHYISVSRAMTNLLIYEAGGIADRYWAPLIRKGSKRIENITDRQYSERSEEQIVTDFVNIIEDAGKLRSQLQSASSSWAPEERKTPDFNELYKFAEQLRDAAGRDGVPQRLRAIAVLREATENNDDLAKPQRERAEDLMLELEAKVAELQNDYAVAGENYQTLGNRYINRSGNHSVNTQMGIECLEKSGDCYRNGARWQKAAQVYGRILSLRSNSIDEKLRVRVRGWEQECIFQSKMNDGTSMGTRDGDAVTLPGHIKSQNFLFSLHQSIGCQNYPSLCNTSPYFD